MVVTTIYRMRLFSVLHPSYCTEDSAFTSTPGLRPRGNKVRNHLNAGQAVSIQFKNEGTMEHTFTIPLMHVDTGGLLPGNSKQITFTAPSTPGTYDVLCAMGGHLQLGMKASIVVE